MAYCIFDGVSADICSIPKTRAEGCPAPEHRGQVSLVPSSRQNLAQGSESFRCFLPSAPRVPTAGYFVVSEPADPTVAICRPVLALGVGIFNHRLQHTDANVVCAGLVLRGC